MEEAFEQCAMAMFGLMTDLARVQMKQVHEVEAEGHDMESLLFHFLDELLFMFSAEPYIVAKVYLILHPNRQLRLYELIYEILFLLYILRFALLSRCRSKQQNKAYP